eukprot:752824-Hanusia_phi.AAC.2
MSRRGHRRLTRNGLLPKGARNAERTGSSFLLPDFQTFSTKQVWNDGILFAFLEQEQELFTHDSTADGQIRFLQIESPPSSQNEKLR